MNGFAFVRTLSLAFGLASVSGVLAVQCEGQDLKEVISLELLPPNVLSILRNQGNGYEIADRGGAYQMTDVVVGKELPFRRFAVAGVAPHCVIVAIEHGGRSYSVELYRLRLDGDTWDLAVKSSTSKLPSTLGDLARSVATRVVRDPANPAFQRTATPPLN